MGRETLGRGPRGRARARVAEARGRGRGRGRGARTDDELAEQPDHGHGDGAGAAPQAARVAQPRDDPADVVAHGRGAPEMRSLGHSLIHHPRRDGLRRKSIVQEPSLSLTFEANNERMTSEVTGRA